MSDSFISLPNSSISSTAVLTTSATVTTSSVVIIAANPARRGLMIYNNSGNSGYITYGPTSSSSTCTAIIATFANYVHSMPIMYTGPISAIRNAGTGTFIITELI